jgi:3-deoxy-7-phosphoheptulonate synthase
MQKIQDVHIVAAEPLVAPTRLKAELPLEPSLVDFVYRSRETVRRIISGEDDRLLCVVGPCSIHDPQAALEYGRRLASLVPRLSERMFVLMRVYFDKPRTSIGWKGLINDPWMDESCDTREGLRIARRLLLDLNRMGLPAATEMLDPITPQYIADLVTWAAIGARTTESQTHREMASGLSMPVGFKNTTDGNLQAAVNAVQSARRPHSFIGITQDGLTAIIRTTGNPDTHVVLRGGKVPNYDAASIAECTRLLTKAGLAPRVLVDCSHAQTNKDYRRQPAVLAQVINQVREDNRAIIGVMLESNLEAGNQPLTGSRTGLKYGVSVTDPCIDWPTTEKCLLEAVATLGDPAAGASASAARR